MASLIAEGKERRISILECVPYTLLLAGRCVHQRARPLTFVRGFPQPCKHLALHRSDGIENRTMRTSIWRANVRGKNRTELTGLFRIQHGLS